MAHAVEDVIARAGVLPGAPAGWRVTHTVLKGGLSHRVIKVDVTPSDAAGPAGPVERRSYVLRVLDPAVSEAGLGIPLRQEIENTVRAARSGVGPQVFGISDDPPAIVLEYIDGPTLGHDDVRRAGMIPRIAAACRRLHAGAPAFVNDFSVFRKAGELVGLCRRHGLAMPDGYTDHLPVLAGVERALAAAPLPAVPCHNDLLPENFMDDGRAVRIVDYQLSGMNDPAFELGDIAAEGDYEPDRTAALTRAYFGAETTPALLARVRLYLLASNFTWTLWFAIHHGLLSGRAADADFDYSAESADKWAQAVRDLSDPELGSLIDAVRGAG